MWGIKRRSISLSRRDVIKKSSASMRREKRVGINKKERIGRTVMKKMIEFKEKSNKRKEEIYYSFDA